ncbi:MAG TPA: oxalate/formate MFS antiporter [Vicinamibacterales bacterium]|nr:oxalate/formate MFS antiporter [Vicinamibacterales bacterium]
MSINNRWFQLCASLIAMIMIANLQYAWTLFVNPLQKGTGWSLTEIQLAFTLFIFFQTWVQPIDGFLIDRLGPRWFITVAGLLCGLGWAGMGYATSLPMLYVLYCAAGIGAAFVYSGSIGSALKWFKERRGLAAGIMAAGFGGGTSLFIPFIQRMLATDGYQTTFLVTGVFQGVVIAIVAQFLKHPPPAAAPVAAKAAATQPIGRKQFTTLEVLTTPHFYAMYVMFVLMATGGLLVTANAGPIAKSWGLSAGALTLAATLSPMANGASRIFWGWASDRIGREMAMIIAFVLQAICLALVVVLGSTSAFWFTTTLVLVYFTWGEIYSLFPSASADYFGTTNATSNYAVLYTAKGVATAIGALGLGAFLYEQTGTWAAGFYISAVMALVAAVMAVALRGRTRPAEVAVPVQAPAPARA